MKSELGRPRRIRTLTQEGTYKISFGNGEGREGFLKLYGSDLRLGDAPARRRVERERTCLQILRGLAVPRLIPIARRALPLHLRFHSLSYIAQSYEGVDFDRAGLSPAQKLPAWLFIAEQLVAFRRHSILYTDMKCQNVVISESPLKVVVIDFGSACPIVNGRADFRPAGISPKFVPPEMNKGHFYEQSAVFQLGMLLAHTLGTNVNTETLLLDPKRLGEPTRILGELGAHGIAPLLARSLEMDFRKRPASYEELLAGIKKARIPEPIVGSWKLLRRPYEKRLAGLGLTL